MSRAVERLRARKGQSLAFGPFLPGPGARGAAADGSGPSWPTVPRARRYAIGPRRRPLRAACVPIIQFAAADSERRVATRCSMLISHCMRTRSRVSAMPRRERDRPHARPITRLYQLSTFVASVDGVRTSAATTLDTTSRAAQLSDVSSRTRGSAGERWRCHLSGRQRGRGWSHPERDEDYRSHHRRWRYETLRERARSLLDRSTSAPAAIRARATSSTPPERSRYAMRG